ncbi:MAG: hypothetical protein ACE5OR_15070, partial [bacterium]
IYRGPSETGQGGRCSTFHFRGYRYVVWLMDLQESNPENGRPKVRNILTKDNKRPGASLMIRSMLVSTIRTIPSEKLMKKVETEMEDELRPEYDLRSLRVRKVGTEVIRTLLFWRMEDWWSPRFFLIPQG